MLRFIPVGFVLLFAGFPVTQWAFAADPVTHPALDGLEGYSRAIRLGSGKFRQAKSSGQIDASGAKLDAGLRYLLNRHLAKALPDSTAASPPAGVFPMPRLRDNNRVQVYVAVADVGPGWVDALQAAGLDIEVVNEQLARVQGWIAIERLPALAAFDNVSRVETPRYGRALAGSRMTEGDAILRANSLRNMGFRGQGVRVGIISDGANNWTAAQASGDLPAGGITRYGSCTKRSADPANCSPAWTCNEGTAMAEIIHDIAPSAKIAVAAASTSLEFIQRANQLADVFGADIIVDDLGFLGEPVFEDGEIATAVAAVASRVLFVSAAGNWGSGHYERAYQPVPGFNFHDFGLAEGAGSDPDNGVLVPGGSSLLVFLQWNDRFSASANDYDLYLFDQQGNIVASSEFAQTGAGSDPIEAFCYYNPGAADQVRWIVINRFAGGARRLEKFMVSRGGTQYNHPAGSIFGHSAVPGVVAVGAINASDSGHDSIAFYSSRGPARIDFPNLVNRSKPDVTAIDGVSVTGSGGFSSPFFGTSAAAPHVAGVAALLMSVSPLANRNKVREALTGGAVDLGAAGFDSVFGYGRVDALRAKNLLRLVFDVSPINLLLDDS